MEEHNGYLYDVYYKNLSGNRHRVRYFGYSKEDAESLFNYEKAAGDEIIIIKKSKKKINNWREKMKDGYGKIIAEIIIIWLIASSLSKLSLQGSRSKADMVKFDDGYCYHEESHIIYIEQVQYGANYTYTPLL